MHRHVFPLVILSFFLLVPRPVSANPRQPQVAHGQAAFTTPAPGTLEVRSSANAIIRWQRFSIDPGETTRFVQPSAASAVLNRVAGADPSAIFGRLASNGSVFLINPHGIVFGPDSVIDTAGLVASSLDIADADFLAGRMHFEGEAGAGPVVNRGYIKAGPGGNVLLIAPDIENSGVIRTDGGSLLLAAGRSVTITSLDAGGLRFEVHAPAGDVLNLGRLIAERGGAVRVFADTLRHEGVIQADGIERSAGGTVVLTGGRTVELGAGSRTSADGGTGGTVRVESLSGRTQVAGAVSSRGLFGSGGKVDILGSEVALAGAVRVDASGETGGGRVRVGGGYQGEDPAVANARQTRIGEDAAIVADARGAGHGGEVIVWSDDTTRFSGTISARGGEKGGDGGFVEVSGKKQLSFAGYVDLRAPQGEAGTLLLDPENLTLGGEEATDGTTGTTADSSTASTEAGSDGSPATDSTTETPSDGFGETTTEETTTVAETDSQLDTGGTSPTYGETATPNTDGTASDGESTLSSDTETVVADSGDETTETTTTTEESATIDAASLETIYADGATVVFQASDTVTIDEAVNLSGGGSLSITAGGDVNVNAPVSLSGGSLSSRGVDFTNRAAISTGGGNVSLDHSGDVTLLASIDTGGGSFSSRGARFDGTGGAISAGSASLNHSAAVALGTMNIGGSLTVDAGGDITQSGALTVAGTADFSTAGTSFASLEFEPEAAISEPVIEEAPEPEDPVSVEETVVDATDADSEAELFTATAEESAPSDPESHDIRLEGDANAFFGKVSLATGELGNAVLRNASPTLELGDAAAGGSLVVETEGDLLGSGSVTAGKEVSLAAEGDVTLAAESRIDVDGAEGGSVTVESRQGTTRVAGEVSAVGTQASGGRIHILGERVELADGAAVDASGETGGGEVLVGGDFQGGNPSVRNAENTVVETDAAIRADALADGSGGKVIVWADGTARVHGSISARGGAAGGDGGLVETSGHLLDVTGARVRADAPNGSAGLWLIDPIDVTIGILDANGSLTGGTWTPSASGSTIANTTIQTALAGGTSVTVTTTGAGAEAGNITVSAPIAQTAESAATLTLQADSNIYVNAGIGTSGAPFNHDLYLIAGNAIGVNNPIYLSDNMLSADAPTIALDAVVDVGTGTVKLDSTGSVTQSASLTAGVLEMLGDGGAHTLTDLGNQVGEVRMDTGAVVLTNNGATKINGFAPIALTAPSPISQEYLGTSIAVHGDVMVVGAPGAFLSGQGAAYVYRWNGSGWVFEKRFTVGGTTNFGSSVAVEGTHIVVGGSETTDVAYRSGIAYAYEWDGSSWGTGTKLSFNGPGFESVFGQSMAMDNGRLVVGGAGNPTGVNWAGKIWWFDLVGGVWTEQGYLHNPAPTGNDYFGLTLDMTGNRLIVGTSVRNGNPGEAYTFDFDSGTRDWDQTQRLSLEVGGDFFGSNVSISGDVAAVARTPNGSAGEVYVFRHNGTSWAQEQILAPTDLAAGDMFGYGVRVRDGVIVATSIRADVSENADAGAGYVFKHDGSQWIQDRKITAATPAAGDWFGSSVALSDQRIFFGAQYTDSGGQANSGAVYGDIPVAAGTTLTGGLTVASSDSLEVNSPITAGGPVNLLASNDLVFNRSVISNGGGDVNLVGGWDGSTGIEAGYDAFDMQNVLSNPASFGGGAGGVDIGSASGATAVSVGAKNGATRVAAGILTLTASDTTAGAYAQLGYPGTASGAIDVFLKGNLTASAGDISDTTDPSPANHLINFAQIGHGGYGDPNSHSGEITIDTTVGGATGTVALSGGSAFETYAMIGHGGSYPDAPVTQSGDISVTAHNVGLTAGSSGGGSYAMIGHGGVLNNGNHLGNVTVNGSAIMLTGSGGAAQIGHGGIISSGDFSGNVTVDGGTVQLFGGGTHPQGPAQIGHGGLFGHGDRTGTIIVDADGLALKGGTDPGSAATWQSYAMIGHGAASGSNAGNRSGDVDVRVSGETGLEDGSEEAIWRIGHRTSEGNVSGSSVLFLSSILDDSAAGGGSGFVIPDFFAERFSENSFGGDVTVGNTGTGAFVVDQEFAPGSDNALHFLSAGPLMVSSPIDNGPSSVAVFVAGWDGATGLGGPGSAEFDPIPIFGDENSYGGGINSDLTINDSIGLGEVPLGSVNLAGDDLWINADVKANDLIQIVSFGETRVAAADIDAGGGAFKFVDGTLFLDNVSGQTQILAGTVDINATGVQVGSVGGTGAARVSATGNLNLFVDELGKFLVQGGSGSGASAEIHAGGTQNIAVTGDMDVLGGSGEGAFAAVDPPAINLSVDGNLVIHGGSNLNAWAGIVGSSLAANVSGYISISGGDGQGAHAKMTGGGSANVNAGGNVYVDGGMGLDAYGTIQGGTTNVAAGSSHNVFIEGGMGDGAFAHIASTSGSVFVKAGNEVSLFSGTGVDADGLIVAADGLGIADVISPFCFNCDPLDSDPRGNGTQEAGIFASSTQTWSGAGGDSLWSTAENWAGGIVPRPTDTVVLPPELTAYINSVETILGLDSEGSLFLDGAILTATEFFNLLGFLGGSGTVETPNLVNEGTLSPGFSVGAIAVTGDYTQMPAGTLVIEVGGPSLAGTDFDWLSVSGSASLDGTVVVSLYDGFVPTASFTIAPLTASAIAGDFATFVGPAGYNVVGSVVGAEYLLEFIVPEPPTVVTMPPPPPAPPATQPPPEWIPPDIGEIILALSSQTTSNSLLVLLSSDPTDPFFGLAPPEGGEDQETGEGEDKEQPKGKVVCKCK